ncbi:mitochondrial processing peptidase beta subunit [Cryptosporidium bovis]|uniref:mitochondrial processing peptidase beta subunit n=1 Tax=Cryptosporidium bovis TaxID=310047 RepID=UPI00351A02FA|nr:mitochondrial processing peptidase beta subunit [Cryptosporidium bovis]
MSLITLRNILNITNTGIGFPSVSRFQNLLYSNKINHFYNNCHGGYKYYSNSTPIKYSSPDFSMSKLSNGIRVATKNMGNDNKSNFITFGLFVDSGVTKEDTGKNGVAHFLEHLMFKGTYKRSKKEIESEIENLGAHLNAYTSREQTVYQIRCFVNDVPKCMDILSDIIKNSKLCKKSIENEREVIIREMEEVYKSEEEAIFDELHSEFYKNNSLGNTILGPKENIISINRNDLINYIRSNYIPNNMVILAVGNIDHEYFKGIANHYFNDINSNDNNNYSSTKIHCSERIPVIIQKRGKHDGKLHIAMGYNGCSLKSIDLPKLMLLKIILGEYTLNEHKNNDIYNSSNNKITQGIIFDIKKYIESFEVFNTCYKDTG